MKKLLVWVFIIFCFVGCNSDNDSVDCSLVLCAGPEFIFEFIDSDTGHNVLGGLFDEEVPDGFLIVLGQDNSVQEFEQDYTVSTAGVVNVFRFSEQFQISLQDVFDITIVYDFETTSNGCCQDYRYENVAVTNAAFEQIEDNNRLILRIFI